MTPSAPRLPQGQEPVPAPLSISAARRDDGDALQAEWGYEAADPALLARLWGEAQIHFNDR